MGDAIGSNLRHARDFDTIVTPPRLADMSAVISSSSYSPPADRPPGQSSPTVPPSEWSEPPSAPGEVSVWNIPNGITALRFVLAIAVVALIPMGYSLTALVIFSIAAATDWIDGYWARKYGQVTKLGRIFDPFVDKIIICGSFIALVQLSDPIVAAWMATVVVGRELLVTSLRAMIEGGGGDFSANRLGKWKMGFQCAAVIAVLLGRAAPFWQWVDPVSVALVWIALGVTVYSGYVYVLAAIEVMSRPSPPQPSSPDRTH